VRVALCSDEPYPVHDTVRGWLEEHGHEVVAFGSVVAGAETPWALAAETAAEAVASGVGTEPDGQGDAGVEDLAAVEERHRRQA
jgi:ribose 5-phosphate isomerase B